MRISDWSSDVCSSDLIAAGRRLCIAEQDGDRRGRHAGIVVADVRDKAAAPRERHLVRRRQRAGAGIEGAAARETIGALRHRLGLVRQRSEEHTSELQSLMRISYAVFCLKKKTAQ